MRCLGEPCSPPTSKIRDEDIGAKVQLGLVEDKPPPRPAPPALERAACQNPVDVPRYPLLLALSSLVGCSRSEVRILQAACEAGAPTACDELSARHAFGLGVAKDEPQALRYGEKAWSLCPVPLAPEGAPAGDRPGCAALRARHGQVVVVASSSGRAGGASAGAVGLDTPGPDTARPGRFEVALLADGKTVVAGESVDDARMLDVARTQRAADPEVRAVIKADGRVPHARVIHTLDLLKQAGISRIAFGVQPAPADSK